MDILKPRDQDRLSYVYSLERTASHRKFAMCNELHSSILVVSARVAFKVDAQIPFVVGRCGTTKSCDVYLRRND